MSRLSSLSFALFLIASSLVFGCSDDASSPNHAPDSPDTGGGGGDAGSSCQDQCDAPGQTECTTEGLRECVEGERCLVWSAPLPCPSGAFCAEGRCQRDSCPPQECTAFGARSCRDGGVAECVDADGDGCLEWSQPQACTAGESCSGGFCAVDCSDECTTVGARQCQANAVVECGDFDSDSCLEWGSSSECGERFCVSGRCEASCIDECLSTDARRCDGAGFQACDDFDSDGCLEWGTTVACEAGQTCSGGRCAVDCSDECDVVGERRCETNSVAVCGDHDADSCLEWGSATPCSTGQTCSNGNCAQECTDECTPDGATTCDTAGVLTCSNYDADSCLEWGTTDFCSPAERCESGACVANPAPTGLVISEVLYDTVGADDDTFVEIHGPAGTDLTGVSLVGVNGNGGSDYNEIQLSGSIPADGLFVVANSDATGAVLAAADITDAKADYQNGPDSIQLRFGAVVLDAVGYGSFDASETFAGEGTPAVDVSSGSSLARDASFTDTDDNATDFAELATPTPGTSSGSPPPPPNPTNTAPTAKLAAIATSSTNVLVDAGASYDAETATAALEVRWDWENDGTWDTGWSTTKTATHSYGSSSSQTIAVEVRDAAGLTDSTTDTIDLSLPTTTAAGAITTDTTWSGHILMTNDVTVEPGVTLTISPGTRVMALHVEDDLDSYGDVALEIEGSVVINGSAVAPVLFTAYEASRKYPGSWQGINNEGNLTTSNLIVEYAHNGIRSETDSQTISGVEARRNVSGFFGRGDDLSLQDMAFYGNETGLAIDCVVWNDLVGNCRYISNTERATISLSNITSKHNGVGVRVVAHQYDSVSLFGITSEYNRVGLQAQGRGDSFADFTASVSVQRSTFSHNRDYGVWAGVHPVSEEAVLGSVTLTQSDVEENGVGVRLNIPGLRGSVSSSDIVANGYAGVAIDYISRTAGDFAFTDNNLHGNGVDGGFTTNGAHDFRELVSYGTDSFSWTSPGGETIFAFYAAGVVFYYGGNKVWVRADDASGERLSRSAWSGPLPNGSGGTRTFESFPMSVQGSDTIHVSMDGSNLRVDLRDFLVWDPTASGYDLLTFQDLTLAGNYLGGVADPSSRVWTAPNVTVDTTGLLGSPVSSAGR